MKELVLESSAMEMSCFWHSFRLVDVEHLHAQGEPFIIIHSLQVGQAADGILFGIILCTAELDLLRRALNS